MAHAAGITWGGSSMPDAIGLAQMISAHGRCYPHVDNGLRICGAHGTSRALIGPNGWFIAVEYRDGS